MKVPRGRRSRAKGRREDRRDAISTRLGRLEGTESKPPEKNDEEGEEKAKEGEKRRRRLFSPRPATPRSKARQTPSRDRETRSKDRKPLARTASAARGAAGRARPAAARARRDSARGLRATAARTGPASRRAWRSARRRALAAAQRAQPRIDWLITLVPRAILWAGRTLAAFGGTLAAVSTRLSRVITPERGIAGVIVCAAACLGVSQFVTYRGVEVGQPQYLGVSGIAPPPQTDRVDAGAAHAYLLIPVAVIAVVLAVAAVHGGRWRLGRLVAFTGLIGIGVSLAIDLPKGLDTGTVGVAFEGAHATLTDGFYAQLAASAVLVLCGLLLSQAVRRSQAAAPTSARRERRKQSRSGTALAGGEA